MPKEDKNMETAIQNPPAEGFNSTGSDPKAIAMADSIMVAMGGRKAWDDLRFVAWNFFGARDLVWDKKTGDVRIDVPGKNMTYLVNVNDMTGRVSVNDKEITNQDTLKAYIEDAKKMFINDSYWLFMPFKLKDSGVTLNYMGTDTMMTGKPADVLSLRFEKVGVTPNNRYLIYVDPEDHMVKQWAYFKDASQDSASAVWPFDNYRNYNGVMLSGDRSDNGGPRNIRVYESLDDAVFKKFEKPDLPKK